MVIKSPTQVASLLGVLAAEVEAEQTEADSQQQALQIQVVVVVVGDKPPVHMHMVTPVVQGL